MERLIEIGTFGVRAQSVILGEVFYFTFPHLFLQSYCEVLSHVLLTLFVYLRPSTQFWSSQVS